jgi:hypothetical protein
LGCPALDLRVEFKPHSEITTESSGPMTSSAFISLLPLLLLAWHGSHDPSSHELFYTMFSFLIPPPSTELTWQNPHFWFKV